MPSEALEGAIDGLKPLIGLGGYMTSGKDAVADFLVEHHGYAKVGMSDVLNDALLTMNPWIPVERRWSRKLRQFRLFRWLPQWAKNVRYQDLHDAVGYVAAKRNPEVRRLLQMLGTDVGRNMISETVWVDIMFHRIEQLRTRTPVVITAMRFRNELKALQEAGGLAAWVYRPGISAPTGELGAHQSENDVSEDMFPHRVDNVGTLEYLRMETRLLAYEARAV